MSNSLWRLAELSRSHRIRFQLVICVIISLPIRRWCYQSQLITNRLSRRVGCQVTENVGLKKKTSPWIGNWIVYFVAVIFQCHSFLAQLDNRLSRVLLFYADGRCFIFFQVSNFLYSSRHARARLKLDKRNHPGRTRRWSSRVAGNKGQLQRKLVSALTARCPTGGLTNSDLVRRHADQKQPANVVADGAQLGEREMRGRLCLCR